ncbi:MAG: PEP-CTERM sorting domain-containing protein [Deltaproteobacteria bacterium]|jgi:hypothetical protein|nr:PEP-CTERM sorting domain-containing protein [Deltaproteobacteria bacterium]
MRILTRLSATCAALVTLLAAGSAAATSFFDFSYTFDDGAIAEGILEGDIQLADTNLIDVLSVSVLSVSGVTICEGNCLATSRSLEPALVSFDGGLVDIIVTPIPQTGDGALAWSSLDTAAYSVGGTIEAFYYDSSRWSLSERVSEGVSAASPVPEPGAAMLFGAGALAVASRLRGQARR